MRENRSLLAPLGRLRYSAARWVIVPAAATLLAWSVSLVRNVGAHPSVVILGVSPPVGPGGPPAPVRPTSGVGAAPAAAGAPLYVADRLPGGLQKELEGKNFKLDPKSGNYLAPKVFAKTKDEELVPVQISGSYVKDLKGRTLFVRQSIRDKLMVADTALFKEKKQHLKINYGFRSNSLQQELYQKLAGKGKVAPTGMSFHETGMAVDLSNWRDAQKFMIEAGFVGGCYGIEEDLVHYSINEVTKASNFSAFRRCTLKEIPKDILKGIEKVGDVMTVGLFSGNKKKSTKR